MWRESHVVPPRPFPMTIERLGQDFLPILLPFLSNPFLILHSFEKMAEDENEADASDHPDLSSTFLSCSTFCL